MSKEKVIVKWIRDFGTGEVITMVTQCSSCGINIEIANAKMINMELVCEECFNYYLEHQTKLVK